MDNHKSTIPFYRDERYINIAAQTISAVVILIVIVMGISNLFKAASDRNLSLSFNFLNEPAGFPISDPSIPYNPSMDFSKAFLVGLLNTLKVAVGGVIAATILGTIVALGRLSTNWLLSRIALIYIEFHRNIPLLVLLFLWYFGVFAGLPKVEDSLKLPGPIYINMRGFSLTWLRLTDTGLIFIIAIAAGVILAITAWIILRKRRELTGKQTYFAQVSLGILIIFPLIGFFLSGGRPFYIDTPTLTGFNYSGGLKLTPEFSALFIGLVMYTAGFIAEVVRAGIQAVHPGQIEAAKAIGLKPTQVLTMVIFPQALRIIIPPMISQYLNLTKNSSLALAIGYQDVFSVAKIAINQAGRAVPIFALVMAVYLTLSLFTSFLLNLLNQRIQLVTR